ncbi:hypothetical protein BD414DRAFT_523025 [Trametes punicea]|nr:hypothetical protein BD414DRAFT_523025 [Trametes punicea]
MDYNSAAWLQTQQIPDLQTVSVHDERSAAGSNDWKDSAASVQAGSGGLNDFLGDMQVQHTPTPPLSQSASTFTIPLPQLLLSTTTSYNAVPYGNQWMSPPPVPLSSYSSLNGATSTSSHSSSQSQGQGQGQGQSQSQGSGSMVIDPALTTMNGSSSSPPPQYQQLYLSSQGPPRMPYQYQQPTHQSMFSINPSFIHTNAPQYQQHQAQQSQQHSIHAIRQSHSPTQQQQQQQGTLSPYALHSPSGIGGHYHTISPSTFYGQPSQPSQPSQPVAGPSSGSSSASSSTAQSTQTPPPAAPSSNALAEQAKARLIADVRPLIQPNSFTGGGAVAQLVNILDDYGIPDVDAQIRLDIVTKIRDCAGNHYFRAWVDNPIAMEIVREWLKLAFIGRNDPQLVETIMPLLHIIDRLPLTLEKLKQSKLGKLIMKLMKEPPTPAIKDMASNLEQRWRKMLQEQEMPNNKAESENIEDTKGKKRRAEPASTKSAPPAKKVAVPAAGPSKAKAVPVKETKPVVKDAKSDSSFFSKPKTTKAQMPSFKKNTSTASASASASAATSTASAKKEPDANVAQPSHFNHFAEILKAYQGSSGAGPSGSTPPPSVPGPSAGPSTGPAAGPQDPPGQPGLKRKKSVKWAPDDRLEQIKLIERAVYDDDGTTGSLPTHNIRDLERDEGAALHNHLFDEQMEWAEPQPLQMPTEIDIPPRGGESQERAAQEEREQSALVVSYASPAQIPDSPAEPPTQVPEEQVDEGVRLMLTGPEVDAIFWSDGMPALVDTIRPSTSVAELVGQLAAPAPPPSQSVPPIGINPEQLQQLAQVLSQGNVFGALAAAPAPPPHAPTGPSHGGDQGWAGQFTEYDRGYHEPNGAGRGGGGDGEPSRRWNEESWSGGGGGSGGPRGGPRGRGRGGPSMRGRGRGAGDGYRITKRKPCSFFQAGRRAHFLPPFSARSVGSSESGKLIKLPLFFSASPRFLPHRCRYGDQCDFSHEPLNYS